MCKSALGDNIGAIADYDKALELEPEDAKAYNNRAETKYAIGDKVGAIADYDKVLELNFKYVHVYNNRGLCKSDLGDDVGAIGDFTKAIELNRNEECYLFGYINRSMSYERLGRYKEALADVNKYLESDPENNNALELKQKIEEKLKNE